MPTPATPAFRAPGPFNATLPAATGQVIGFMRDPMKTPFLNYVQLVPVPQEGNGLYRWWETHPDDPARLDRVESYAWAFDDPSPEGKDFQMQFRQQPGQTTRYAFAYRMGDRTRAGYQKGMGIDLLGTYGKVRMGHAMLHRAYRVSKAIKGYAWPATATYTLNGLLNTSGAAVDLSSGEETLGSSGSPNPNFQVIKRMLNAAMVKLDLATNSALTGEEFCVVMGPYVAQKWATSGEIVNFLKQSPLANQLMVRNNKWGLPDSYNGWKLVVDDTVRVSIRQRADGDIAVIPTEKDYVWNDDTIVFCSRVANAENEGAGNAYLDGGYGFPSFSTFQMFYYGGLAVVEGHGDSWNQLTTGRITIEDEIRVTSPLSGLLVTNTLSS